MRPELICILILVAIMVACAPAMRRKRKHYDPNERIPYKPIRSFKVQTKIGNVRYHPIIKPLEEDEALDG